MDQFCFSGETGQKVCIQTTDVRGSRMSRVATPEIADVAQEVLNSSTGTPDETAWLSRRASQGQHASEWLKSSLATPGDGDSADTSDGRPRATLCTDTSVPEQKPPSRTGVQGDHELQQQTINFECLDEADMFVDVDAMALFDDWWNGRPEGILHL